MAEYTVAVQDIVNKVTVSEETPYEVTVVAATAISDSAVEARVVSTDNSGEVTEFVHGLLNTDVVVQVFEKSSGSTVVGQVDRDDANQVTVTLGGASAGEYRIVVTG